MQKNFTFSLLILTLALLVLGGCNRSQGLDVKNIKIVSYQVSGLESVEDSKALERTLEDIKGVTAAAVNSKSMLAAVTYYPDETNERKIRNVLSQTPGLEVKENILKADPNKPGCPAKSVRDWLSFN